MNKDIFKSINLLQKKLNATLAPIQNIQKQLYPFLQAQNEIQKKLIPLIQIQKINEKFIKGYNKQSKIFSNVIIMLGKEGWFIDINMSLSYIRKMENILKDKNIQSPIKNIQKELISYYHSNIEEIENSLTKKFPHRSRIISSALQAHKEKKYELSIPVLLTQIDGICHEQTGKYYFMKKRGTQVPQTIDYIEETIQNEFEKSISTGLVQDFPINHSKKQRESFNSTKNTFNRHQIIHGEIIDYPTKINSLKAISLINYISQILSIEK